MEKRGCDCPRFYANIRKEVVCIAQNKVQVLKQKSFTLTNEGILLRRAEEILSLVDRSQRAVLEKAAAV